jgi:iron complex outermembrane receptor protein
MFKHSVSRRLLFAGVSAWSLGLGAALPALAQDTGPTPDEPTAVGELVVTARRREEKLNDVPISVSVQSGSQLEDRGAKDITALQRLTPNLTMQVSRGTNSTLTAFIRGIGQQDPLWGFEPGVGLYVDDVYIARPQGAVLDIYDIDRIEVLRGPQGTLYGRNTIGGAVKYVTKRLDPIDPHLRVKGSLGSYDQRDLIVSGSMPLGGKAAIGLAIAEYDRDGFGRNLYTGAETNNKDVISGRISFEATPTESLFLRLSADYLEDGSNANHGHRERPVPAALAALVNPASCRVVLADPYDTCAGLGDKNEVISEGVSLLAEWKPEGKLTYKSITAYRKGRTNSRGIDFDNTPAPILDVAAAPPIYADDQTSEELQALYGGDRLQAVVGLYFLDASASGRYDTILGAAGLTQGTFGGVDTRSFAAFGDASYTLSDRLSLSVGARWTRDKKTARVFKANYLGLGSPVSGGNSTPFQTLTDYSASATFQKFTPRLSLTYKLTDETNVYVAYSQGFKSGGFDMRGDATATPATKDGYKPETVDSYEAGLKGTFFDGRLHLTTAIFDAKYKGQQITTQRLSASGTSVVSFVENVGNSTIKGWELESQAQITTRLGATFVVGYVDAQFDKYLAYVPNPAPPPAFVQADVSAQRQFQNTPQWTGNFSLNFTQPLSNGGKLQLIGATSYRSDTSMFETPAPIVDQKAYSLYDASIIYAAPSNRWKLGVYGRNLADKRYRTGAYVFAYDPASPSTIIYGDSVIGFYAAPRTVTATLEINF